MSCLKKQTPTGFIDGVGSPGGLGQGGDCGIRPAGLGVGYHVRHSFIGSRSAAGMVLLGKVLIFVIFVLFSLKIYVWFQAGFLIENLLSKPVQVFVSCGLDSLIKNLLSNQPMQNFR